MISLSQKTKIIKKQENTTVFEINGLYPGYGVTIGNSLRRTLISSLEGAAITQANIKGVSHEFSTMSGVLEDVVMILLNLKKIRFKMHSNEPQKGSLNVKGEKKVKAGDFKLPPQVEVVNKDAHIATLTSKNANLEIEIQIEKGIGYEPVEQRKKEKLEIGAIQIDAIYTPIKRVSLKCENMRVGERTDYDKLILEIETDGTIIPEQAFEKACEILIQHFSFLSQGLDAKKDEKPKKVEKPKQTKKEKSVSIDAGKAKIQDMKISPKVIKILQDNKIKSAKGLTVKSQEDILDLKGMGQESLKEIKKALKKLGLNLKS